MKTTSPFDAFTTYGATGLELARAEERRAADQARAAASRQLPQQASLLRRWLGASLMFTGALIAGPDPAPVTPVSAART